VFACWLVTGENAVQLATRPSEQIAGRGNLTGRSRPRDLHEGGTDLLMEIPQRQHGLVHGAGYCIPGRHQLVPMRLHVRSSCLSQVVDAAPRFLFDADEALILEQLEGRIDRPRAGPPEAATPLADLLNDLVTMLGPFRQ
jgi:hypothetical protein